MHSAYFKKFLPTLIGRPLVPGNEALSASFTVAVSDAIESSWTLFVERGKLVKVCPSSTDTPVTFALRKEVFEQLARGVLSPVDAFLAQQIVIEGDVEQGLVLGAVLEAFFQQYPYEV